MERENGPALQKVSEGEGSRIDKGPSASIRTRCLSSSSCNDAAGLRAGEGRLIMTVVESNLGKSWHHQPARSSGSGSEIDIPSRAKRAKPSRTEPNRMVGRRGQNVINADVDGPRAQYQGTFAAWP